MIKTPPKFNPDWINQIDDISEYWDLFKLVDEKGRYLHWDELRHRIGELNGDLAWSVVKSSRQPSRQFFLSLPKSIDKKRAYANIIPSINRRCSYIDRWCSSAAYSSMMSELSAIDYLVEDIIEEESIASSQLEGAATTRTVAKEMLKTKREPRSPDEKMILGNYKMMSFVWENRNETLDTNLLLTLHRIGTEGIEDEKYHPGKIRTTDDVVVEGRDGEVLHQPPNAAELKTRIKTICKWANFNHTKTNTDKYIHPLVKAVLLHFSIGYEHPFYDGNGRVARALFYWQLFKSGYKSFRYISISKLLKKAPVQYGKSYLYTESDDHDLTYFIDYQCQTIERAVTDFVKYVQKTISARQQFDYWIYESRLSATLNERQRGILRQLGEGHRNLFTAKELQGQFNISNNTSRADLEKLVQLNFLSKRKIGRETDYIGITGYENIRKTWDKLS